MGRPKKDDPRKMYGVRLNEEEHKIITEKAEMVGMTLSEYLRHIGLKKRQPSPPKKLPEITKETFDELSKVGNNVNQIARKANQYENIDAKKLDNVVERFERLIVLIQNKITNGT